MKQENEIILYQPDSTITIEVRVEDETVWLTQAQMAELFLKDQSVIARHISNIFKEGELEKESNMQILHNTLSRYKPTQVYSLDVIISVGYRVKSKRGTLFRQWANKVLKEYLLKGYSVNQRFTDLENKIDNRFYQQQRQIDDLVNKIDFVINSSIKPKEGILFEGQIFDAHNFAINLIRSAQERVIIIDNYVDNTVLTLLDNRKENVFASVYTSKSSAKLQLDIEKHDSQYPPIKVNFTKGIHDRFIIIDNELYHIGASIKDLGKKLFAFSKMEASPQIILDHLKV